MTARGCGGSGLASDGYSLDLQIRDLIGFLDAMNIKRATFAGHSASGGKVVLRVVWLEDASHYLFVDRAREVAKQMSDFLIETRK